MEHGINRNANARNPAALFPVCASHRFLTTTRLGISLPSLDLQFWIFLFESGDRNESA